MNRPRFQPSRCIGRNYCSTVLLLEEASHVHATGSDGPSADDRRATAWADGGHCALTQATSRGSFQVCEAPVSTEACAVGVRCLSDRGHGWRT